MLFLSPARRTLLQYIRNRTQVSTPVRLSLAPGFGPISVWSFEVVSIPSASAPASRAASSRKKEKSGTKGKSRSKSKKAGAVPATSASASSTSLTSSSLSSSRADKVHLSDVASDEDGDGGGERSSSDDDEDEEDDDDRDRDGDNAAHDVPPKGSLCVRVTYHALEGVSDMEVHTVTLRGVFDANMATVQVELKAQVGYPRLSFATAGALDFGTCAVGADSPATLPLVLTNREGTFAARYSLRVPPNSAFFLLSGLEAEDGDLEAGAEVIREKKN